LENLDLELEHNLKVPAPLDPHIASVSIRTGANNPSDYFDLMVSATFGTEYVTIKSGDDTFEIKISIKKAEIKFDPLNCDLHVHAPQRSDAWSGTETLNSTASKAHSVDSEALAMAEHTGSKLKGGLKASTTAKIDLASSQQGNVDLSRDVLPYRVLDSNTLQVGYPDKFEHVLSGKIVDEAVRVRATPSDIGKQVGVLARIRVREHWIEIDDIQGLSVGQKMRSLFDDLKKGGEAAANRKLMFKKLLAHLVAINLQREEDQRDATFAASAIVFSPVDKKPHGLIGPQPEGVIVVDPTAIDRFISAGNENLAGVLDDLGVGEEAPDDRHAFDHVWSLCRFGSVYRLLRKETFIKALSSSFGWVVHVEKGEMGFHCITITDEPHPTADAEEIVDMLGGFPVGVEAAVYFGILAKGEGAFGVAEFFGYPYGRASLRRKLGRHSLYSSYGYLSAFHRIERVVSDGRSLNEFVGSKSLTHLMFEEDVSNSSINFAAL
jgi:hypothetical protein